ncbi:MAG: peptidoglycan DD-metalloendopeptidase family protein [Rhizobiales bacterium]|nr:peptidoglycan DD-metalloendopeptidase family protein [Hyphomicrobiales bacterium]
MNNDTDDSDAQASEALWPRLRRQAHFSTKLYISASRVALGHRRWVAAASLMGVLSLGLLGGGVYALTSSYEGVQKAALTADSAPQIMASGLPGTASPTWLAHADQPQTAANPVATLSMAQPEAAPDTTNPLLAANDDTATASISALRPTQDMAPEAPSGPEYVHTTIELSSGETLMQVLTQAGADRVDAYHAVAALKDYYSPTKLRVGQAIDLTFQKAPENDLLTEALDDKDVQDSDAESPALVLTSLALQPDIERSIQVNRSADGAFTSEEIQKQLTSAYARGKGSINSSLFLDAEKAGVPAPIIVQMIRMFSYSVDFQREIHPGDKFEVYFDRKLDEDGNAVKSGDIAYASLTVNGRQYRLWRYETADGGIDYFDDKGQSMKKFLMRTPIDGARISSGFGYRKHPILGYSKLHSGVDFAAPRGTPIYAAGNGKIEIAGWVNGYGKYVQIQHANNYETAYGHMSAFARGIKPGVRVKQGQVIGYVGTTGRSTGPHLHYEVHLAGKKVNPLGLKMATGVKLEKKEMAAFQAKRALIDRQMAETPTLTKVAQASTDKDASKAN